MLISKIVLGDRVRKTLKVLRDAYGMNAAAFDGQLIDGVGRVFHTYNGKIDEPALTGKLAKAKGGAPGIVGRAKALRDLKGGTVAKCVGGVIVEAYNAGRRTLKLEGWWK